MLMTASAQAGYVTVMMDKTTREVPSYLLLTNENNEVTAASLTIDGITITGVDTTVSDDDTKLVTSKAVNEAISTGSALPLAGGQMVADATIDANDGNIIELDNNLGISFADGLRIGTDGTGNQVMVTVNGGTPKAVAHSDLSTPIDSGTGDELLTNLTFLNFTSWTVEEGDWVFDVTYRAFLPPIADDNIHTLSQAVSGTVAGHTYRVAAVMTIYDNSGQPVSGAKGSGIRFRLGDNENMLGEEINYAGTSTNVVRNIVADVSDGIFYIVANVGPYGSMAWIESISLVDISETTVLDKGEITVQGETFQGDDIFQWKGYETTKVSTNDALDKLSDGDATPILGSTATKASAGNHGHAASGISATGTYSTVQAAIDGFESRIGGTGTVTSVNGKTGDVMLDAADVGAVATEVDPSWAAVSNTVTTQAGNGATAYSWGDHSTNGYMTSLSDDTSPSLLGGLNASGYGIYGLYYSSWGIEYDRISTYNDGVAWYDSNTNFVVVVSPTRRWLYGTNGTDYVDLSSGSVQDADIVASIARDSEIAALSNALDSVAFDGVPDASITTKGIVEKATDTEASTGTDTNRYVTPYQLATYGGGGGITESDATNIARTVAWTPGLTPYALTAASTVTVTRAMLATNAVSLTLTGNTVLSLTTNGWALAELGRWSIDINKGAHTLGFDTAVYDNTTVLDTTGTRVALFIRKHPGETKHRVRQ
jgi:hypothetical protein